MERINNIDLNKAVRCLESFGAALGNISDLKLERYLRPTPDSTGKFLQMDTILETRIRKSNLKTSALTFLQLELLKTNKLQFFMNFEFHILILRT